MILILRSVTDVTEFLVTTVLEAKDIQFDLQERRIAT